jgi:protein phosphatase
MHVEAFGLTDPGLKRGKNEDAYAALPHLGVFMVADGMGGHAAGDVAAQMAVDTVREEFEGAGALRLAHADPFLLAGGVETANARIYAAAEADPKKNGMGSTFTGLLVVGNRVAIVHVGDSRAYRWRARRLEQLTEDHTWGNAMVQAGAMTLEDAMVAEQRGLLTRAVGSDEQVEVDTRIAVAESGDVYLLSTDGLHGVIGNDAIADVLRAEQDLPQAAQRMIELANANGGHDNVTVVLVRIGQ